ncbi:MAG: hypothetical protein CM15mP83_4420 [Flavobacteriaceae bacterium]|nr:MAG: hypothetical protein CM15mP83_4420 [Flavobacteriaceae bacterium]
MSPAVSHVFPLNIKSLCVIFKSAPIITTDAPSPKINSKYFSGIKTFSSLLLNYLLFDPK